MPVHTAAVSTTAALLIALAPALSQAEAEGSGIGAVAYDLGRAAFRTPAMPEPLELTAVVHYPVRRSARPAPVVLMLHGSWHSCADNAEWPCQSSAPMPSHRGYDYLGRALAQRGIIAVAIAANAVEGQWNKLGATGPDRPMQPYQARADLINKHLAMWQRLAATGEGELAGRFIDPDTGAPREVDFRGRADLSRVGTLGHSRGGKAVMWQAADRERGKVPAGVRVRAVLPVAPVYFPLVEGDVSDGLVTTAPVRVLISTCDGAIGEAGRGYVRDALAAGTKFPVSAGTYRGGNHNFFNTQWSPESGQQHAYDDAPGKDEDPQLPAGHCRQPADDGVVRQLTESEQRGRATDEVVKFFTHALR
ncbi:hypothetical protein M8C13_06000 [Crossiella sp. SN42]|uniref:hypothetical protein n=1 Tax=Crossiella sp. SN42 TaxID=2944808 RepID=UPI00207D233B|nr:hypothetical protein [Crossiella sp. SN42]MCO1575311.1 hypothetical protein [Crossiella sp. SN42]